MDVEKAAKKYERETGYSAKYKNGFYTHAFVCWIVGRETEINPVIDYCKKIKQHNYGMPKIIKKFNQIDIFNAIKSKRNARITCFNYKDSYTWLKFYDEEINFLIDYIEELKRK